MLNCAKASKTFKYHDNQIIDLSTYPTGHLPMQNVDQNGNLEDYKDMVDLPFMHEVRPDRLQTVRVAVKPWSACRRERMAIYWTSIVFLYRPQFSTISNSVTFVKSLTHVPVTLSLRLILTSGTMNSIPRKSAATTPIASCGNNPQKILALSCSLMSTKYQLSHTRVSPWEKAVDQSILVSGESGAGKTETVKICLNHIASVQRGRSLLDTLKTPHMTPWWKGSWNQILCSRLLVTPRHAATTTRLALANICSSSSRRDCSQKPWWSKLLVVALLDPSATSTCSKRIVLLDMTADERTFHIFYQLLAAPDNTKGSILGRTSWCKEWVIQVRRAHQDGYDWRNAWCWSIPGDTPSSWACWSQGEKLNDLMQAMCIVLQLGNLSFTALHGNSDKSKVATRNELKALSDLMGVSCEDLTLSFTERTFKTANETYKVPLNAEAAKEACDALAKEAYQKTFLWLVNAINKATCADESSGKTYGTIGLLDIFGFESFRRTVSSSFASTTPTRSFSRSLMKTSLRTSRPSTEPKASAWKIFGTMTTRCAGLDWRSHWASEFVERRVCSSQGKRLGLCSQGSPYQQELSLFDCPQNRPTVIWNQALCWKGHVRCWLLCRQEHGHASDWFAGMHWEVQQQHHQHASTWRGFWIQEKDRCPLG